MKRIFTIFSILMLIISGCQKNEMININSGIKSINATIESVPDTKASLVPGNTDSDAVSVVWDADDAISVFVKKNNTVHNIKYVLDNSTAGTANGTFKMEDETNLNVDLSDAVIVAAIYPYAPQATCNSNGYISGLVLSNTFTYSENLKAAPMAAKSADGTSLTFKNVGALVKVTTSNVTEGYTTLELSSEQSFLAGKYNVSFNNITGAPTATLQSGDISNSKTITITETLNQPVYFPIFAGTYTDLTVKAKKTDSDFIELISPKALTAERSNVYYTTAAMTIAQNQKELTEIVSNNSGNLNVELKSNMNNLTLPATQSTSSVSLAFTTTETAISVKQESENTTDAVEGNVNLEINTASNESKRTLEVILPSSTVAVKGNTTYSSIIASTAENTLILGDGVIAEKVIVKKGNIRVDAGSKLLSIEFGSDSNDADKVLIIDNGGEIADAVYNNPYVTVKTMGEMELRRKLESGESVQLTEDVVVNGDAINITGAVVMELSDYKITYTGNDVLFRVKGESALLRISTNYGVDGEIYTEASNPTTTNGNGYIGIVSEGATLAITGGKFSVGTCTIAQVNDENSTLQISGGTFEAREDLTVNGNPNYYNYNRKYTLNQKGGKGTIRVTGGTFISYDPSNSAGENPYADFVQNGNSVIYDSAIDSYIVKKGIYNEAALIKAIKNGSNSLNIQSDLTISKLDLTNITVGCTINLNGHTITTTEPYGIHIKPTGKDISIKNGNIVMTKQGTYETYTAGIKIENGDYNGSHLDLRSLSITMANADWAYAINLPAGVTNISLYVQNCTLEGAIALQCWGDNNDIDLLYSTFKCNYITNENYGSSCVAFQSNADYQAQNNDVIIKGCNFLYTGTNNFNKDIVAVDYSDNDNNTFSFYETNTCGEGVTSKGRF